MIFALLGFGAILLDRQQSADRLAVWIARKRSDWGPALWFRPWLLAAGAAFGAAAAVKWNGLYFLAGLAVYTLVVDAIARRKAGIPFWLTGTILKQGPVSFLLTVPIAVAVYLASWSGWFATDGGYDRHWAEQPGNAWTGPLAWVPDALQSLWHFQVGAYNYHVGENRPHAYSANPLTWLLSIRPTGMYYRSVAQAEDGCLSQLCGENVSGIPNPFIWWAATAAVVYLLVRLIRRREWQVGLVLAGFAVGYLPWLLYTGRTVFQFYTIAFEPYLILALTLAIGVLIGTRDDPEWRRVNGLATAGVFVTIAALTSVFFFPMWTGILSDYWFLASHWWLPTWR
jgi:dolichyl-phosphate-mannose--protein O-mannosyl transferase